MKINVSCLVAEQKKWGKKKERYPRVVLFLFSLLCHWENLNIELTQTQTHSSTTAAEQRLGTKSRSCYITIARQDRDHGQHF